MPDTFRSPLEGKSVVIFGGTSGIGLSAAQQAQAAGASVIVIGFDAEGAARVAAQNGFAGWRAADVTRPETIDAALKGIDHVDHLVLLAGTFVVGKVMEAEVSHLRRAFEERIWAAIHTLRGLGERLDRNASVTFISGVLADRPSATGTAVLAAASAAMEALARGLVLELAPRRVNTLSPGTTDTPLLARTLGDAREGYIAALKEKLPLGRLGTPEALGAAVVFLMSNDFINGETLHVDGGSRLV